MTLHDSSHGKKNTILYRSSGRNSFMYLSVFRPIIALYDFMNAVTPGHSYHQGCKIIRPRPQPRPYSFWLRPRFRPRSWHLASALWKLASWPRIFTVHMALINIHNIASASASRKILGLGLVLGLTISGLGFSFGLIPSWPR